MRQKPADLVAFTKPFSLEDMVAMVKQVLVTKR
jgi:hypothetical protein